MIPNNKGHISVSLPPPPLNTPIQVGYDHDRAVCSKSKKSYMVCLLSSWSWSSESRGVLLVSGVTRERGGGIHPSQKPCPHLMPPQMKYDKIQCLPMIVQYMKVVNQIDCRVGSDWPCRFIWQDLSWNYDGKKYTYGNFSHATRVFVHKIQF